MKLDEAEREIFDQLIKNFTDQNGFEVLKNIYKLHRQLTNELCLPYFPITEIRNHLLYLEFTSGKYTGMSLHQIAIHCKKEIGISERKFYDFYHEYYLPRLKQEKRQKLR